MVSRLDSSHNWHHPQNDLLWRQQRGISPESCNFRKPLRRRQSSMNISRICRRTVKPSKEPTFLLLNSLLKLLLNPLVPFDKFCTEATCLQIGYRNLRITIMISFDNVEAQSCLEGPIPIAQPPTRAYPARSHSPVSSTKHKGNAMALASAPLCRNLLWRMHSFHMSDARNEQIGGGGLNSSSPICTYET